MNISGLMKRIIIKDQSNLLRHLYFDVLIFKKWKILKKIFQTNLDRVFICPYKGTGDVYTATSLLASVIPESNRCNQRICVVGKSNEKIVDLFGFSNRISISQEDMDSLIRLLDITGEKSLNITILHPDPPFSRVTVTDRMRNFNDFNFTDFFQVGVFKGRNTHFMKPYFNAPDYDEVLSYFNNSDLKLRKTVLLAPYVNTLGMLPMWFWIELAGRLTSMGYVVCTNCFGKELPIVGTKRVELQFKDLGWFLENAGFFISSRSGLCDIISSVNACKIVIYQGDEYWGDGKPIDYFSLNRMNLCNDAIEISFSGIDFYHLMDLIIKRVCNWKN